MTERIITEQTTAESIPSNRDANPSAANWNRWEGQSVNGEFPLRQFLGGTGHSAVYLTETVGQNPQKAAIKLMRAGADADAQLSRWKSAMSLSHPGLLRILSVGRSRLNDTDLLFVVMDYAEENLSQILPQRVLTAAEARDMLSPTLDVLSFLHAKGLALGHLKPSNILASHEQLQLAGDNIRRDGDSSAADKSTAYDAPEHARSGIAVAGDIWSLGITLCEALTGTLPSVTGAAVTPELPKNLPAEFIPMVSNCLQRDPQRRWTAAEIGAGLRPSSAAALPAETEQTPSNGSARSKSSGIYPEAVAKRSLLLPAVLVGLIAVALTGYLLFHKGEARNPEQSVAADATSRQPVDSQPVASDRHEPTQGQHHPATSEAVREAPGTKQNRAVPVAALDAGAHPKVNTRETTPSSPEIFLQALPIVPQSARNTIEGKIRVDVRVNVDPSGNVTGNRLDRSGPSKYFARLATEAAQEWKFKPQSSAREWVLHFRFSRAGVAVDPVPVDR